MPRDRTSAQGGKGLISMTQQRLIAKGNHYPFREKDHGGKSVQGIVLILLSNKAPLYR